MGIYSERKIGAWSGWLIIIFSFMLIYLPWLSPERELFRGEGLYAAEAMEFDFASPVVTAHQVAITDGYPLFPAAAALLSRDCGIPMETVLRGISVVMFAATAILVFFAAASERSRVAGFAAMAMYISSGLTIEKVIDGDPTTSGAFFLAAAQLLFFNYGIRRADWNRAWIISALLAALGFLSCGFKPILCFVVPMFFFRRPLSVKSKFRKPGFIAALVIGGMAIGCWLFSYTAVAQRLPLDYPELPSIPEYLREICQFPLLLIFRLLPWSLIAWLPFCVALQALDTTPILSRYLRTLTISTLALLWLLPNTDSRESLYLLAPLSILFGINYELGMRRYGGRFRRLLRLGEYFALLTAVGIVVACFAPPEWLSTFFSIDNTLDFRNIPAYRLAAGAALVLVLATAFFLHRARESFPVWMLFLACGFTAGIFAATVLLPYRAQEQEKRRLGNDIRQALAGENTVRLYKSEITDLYGGLYYSGVPVVKLQSLSELPRQEEVVYLINTDFPQHPERSWSNLFPADYTYNRRRLALWKGVIRPAEKNSGSQPESLRKE